MVGASQKLPPCSTRIYTPCACPIAPHLLLIVSLELTVMSHIPAEVADTKPIENIHPNNLPAAGKEPDHVAVALETLVKQSEEHDDVRNGMHAPMHQLHGLPLVHRLLPGLKDLATEYHVGNYVIVRATGERIFESMPIYPR